MKYIRTKNGNVFELEYDGWLTKRAKPKHIETLVAIDDKHYEMRKIVHEREIGKKYWETEILKQADTIEELCDRCVCFFKGEEQPYICPIKDIEHLKELEQFGGKIGTNIVYEKVYAAIWTDKGLIYVAKMNEKGELELL